jgi:hypothetical protein
MRTKVFWVAVMVGCSTLVAAFGVGGSAAAAIPAATPCGTQAGQLPQIDHVVWILYENKTRTSVMTGPDAPYIQSVAAQCGEATNWNDLSTTSLANYVAMTSGSLGSAGAITSNRSPKVWPQSSISIFEHLGVQGVELAESMPSNCFMKGSGDFSIDHTAYQYYTRINKTLCPTQARPLNLAAPGLSAKLTMIIPNNVNDMHKSPQTPTVSSRIRAGDTWTRSFLPTVLASPEYQAGHTVVILTWDEAIGTAHNVPFVVISPYTRAGTKSAVSFDHYSLLKSTQLMLGDAPLLGHAADPTTGDFRSAFGLG